MFDNVNKAPFQELRCQFQIRKCWYRESVCCIVRCGAYRRLACRCRRVYLTVGNWKFCSPSATCTGCPHDAGSRSRSPRATEAYDQERRGGRGHTAFEGAVVEVGGDRVVGRLAFMPSRLRTHLSKVACRSTRAWLAFRPAASGYHQRLRCWRRTRRRRSRPDRGWWMQPL